MLAALQGERSDFDMFSISERGVRVKAETRKERGPDPLVALPEEL